MYDAVHSAFPDVNFDIRDLVASGDKVAPRWVITGTQVGPFAGFPPTGRRIEIDGCVMFHMENGRAKELWATRRTSSV